MLSNDSALNFTREGPIATLCFTRPEALNAINVTMAQEFLAAVRQIASDRSVRAVLLRGAGRAFMAGGDLSVMKGAPVDGATALIDPLHEAIAQLDRVDAPVVAEVHGVVAGAGMSLMLQADLVIAAEDTRFGMAFVKVGASCDTGSTWALPRRIGLGRALEMAMLGDLIDAPTAARLGLINRVVSAADLEAEGMALALRFAQGPTVALGHIRRLLRQSADRDLTGQLQAEREAFRACAATADFASGVDAFFAKRAPAFGGS